MTQHSLFETEPPEWEVDAADERRVVTVVVPQGPPKPLDYLVPETLRDQVQPGCRVRVPLGRSNRAVIAYCVELAEQGRQQRRLKEIREVVDHRSLLSPAMLRLTRWMADYYLCGWGQVLDAVVPAGVRGQAGTRLVTLLSPAADLPADRSSLKLPAKQAEVLDYILTLPKPITPEQLATICRCSSAPITGLRRRGLIVARTERMQSTEVTLPAHTAEEHLALNEDQQQALNTILGAIDSGKHETILIRGVTGSGKTEVYIHAIREVISFGRQAIILVPEISLTPQTEARFRARFGKVAVLHSHLTDSERHWHWGQIADGNVHVIVGARSAVFAPTPHLGLIVIDEEHEGTFKQDSAPRYHARDVAARRAKAEGIPLVLGSATPSLESWQRAAAGQYRLIEMPRRVYDRPMPQVATIDLRAERQDRMMRGALSRPLAQAMERALAQDGQVILLLNRRGFATHVQCPACGETMNCPHCEIALTHHRHAHVLICHYCDHQRPEPDRCVACGFDGLRFAGRGTQKLEMEVRARFPGFECLRMDTDSMQKPGSHEKALARFRDGEVRILLGTQMIAKGLDFPDVTLVGVINADTALHLPDFRAAERTFQLVTQVAGRTGRGPRGGRVLVQTCEPEHPAIRAAVRHDYVSFAAHELPIRESHGYPPFTTMVRLLVRGPGEDAARGLADKIRDRLIKALAAAKCEARLLGPAPAAFPKLQNHFRFVVQLLAADGDALRGAVRAAVDELEAPQDVIWTVDVDPLDMM